MQNAQKQSTKILVSGSVNGSLTEYFSKVGKLDAKHGPFSVLLVTGNIFGSSSDDDEDVDPLLSGRISVPVMTYVSVGDRELPPRVQERASQHSGEICNNLVALKGHGVLQTTEGVKVAYIGGRYSAQTRDMKTDVVSSENEDAKDQKKRKSSEESDEDENNSESENVASEYTSFDNSGLADLVLRVADENVKASQNTEAQPSIDVLLTYDWPNGITTREQMGAEAQEPQLACSRISYASAAIMPRYHFASGEGLFFERLPWKYSGRIRTGSNKTDSTPHFTRFVGLGSVNLSEHGKQRWFYAMNVAPLQSVSQGAMPPSELPANCTPNPLYQFGRLDVALDKKMVRRIVSDIESADLGNAGGRGNNDRNSGSHNRRPPPPLDYVCRSCSQPGHWISDCPTREQSKRQRTDRPPPPDYICYKCKQPGHWKSDCPAGAIDDGSATAEMLSKCWFCLANPDVDQNLMVAIGDEAYVAMSKGALVVGDDGSAGSGNDGKLSPIPGGGHVLIVPIAHVDSLRKSRESSSETEQNLCVEIDRWIKAITALFAEYDCVPFTFETCRCLPYVHTSVQMIPIPRAKLPEFNASLKNLCKQENVDIKHEYPEDINGGYFAFNDLSADASDASGEQLYIHISKKARSFNLQFGRKLAADILGIPERENWKSCVVSEEAEASERDKFIAAFAPHNFAC
ncbi:hypothetical protein GGI15_000594 [Coemansia interrupta]|uniref:CCHC-type domain-containing protein n=1 Tax=Coemansia interrupta TaxID=1126814 RepID=A0A9W8HKZ2_9FUNG|nr:hypothetical protein GGI15_000594 [Coemansia interrupta]